jgi:hypothetical protein
MTDANDTMHDEPLDPRIERVAESLRAMPAVDPSAIARVLVATAAAEQDDARRRARNRRLRTRTLLAGALAASLAIGVGLARLTGSGAGDPVAPAATLAAPAPGGRQAGPAASGATLAASTADAASVTVQLVMRAPTAHHMAVVGDFTGWDDARVPMVRDPASGLWSATVTVRPGRHVYAFVADDSVWMRDPSAPVATDADFGRPGSLLLVGRP